MIAGELPRDAYIRIKENYTSSQGITLYRGQIYRRLSAREEEDGVSVALFEGRASVPWTHAEVTGDEGNLPAESGLQDDVRSALLDIAVATPNVCREMHDPTSPTNKDTFRRMALNERRVNDALAPLFRRYRADPARYAEFQGSVQPDARSLRAACRDRVTFPEPEFSER
jgi:hypothetical protein